MGTILVAEHADEAQAAALLAGVAEGERTLRWPWPTTPPLRAPAVTTTAAALPHGTKTAVGSAPPPTSCSSPRPTASPCLPTPPA